MVRKDVIFIIEIVSVIIFFFVFVINSYDKQKCPLINSCATFRLLRLRVRISPGAWASVSSECYVFSGRDFCDGRSHEVCVCVCVSLNMKRCNNYPVQLQWADRKRSKQERKKVRKELL